MTDVSVACKVLKFADDTKIYKVVNSQEDIESLHNDVKNLVKWSVDWQMLFNADKCKIIHTGHSNCHADYYMCGNKLETVDEEKDLGVIVSKDLKWDKQRKYAFSNRVIDHWNSLSDVCVTSNTINQFKNCLKWELQPETHS